MSHKFTKRWPLAHRKISAILAISSWVADMKEMILFQQQAPTSGLTTRREHFYGRKCALKINLLEKETLKPEMAAAAKRFSE